jgi:hypothetical protein
MAGQIMHPSDGVLTVCVCVNILKTVLIIE